jgi:starch-binding outer membrane protein, SusD/RagB family
VEGMLVSSYGIMLGRGLTNVFVGGSTNWFAGSVCGGDANKGSEAGDAAVMNAGQRYEMTSTHQVPDWKWQICYESIARANNVLKNADKATDMSAADKTRVKGEARFLRGHAYFELQKHFNKVPYIDETTADPGKVPNSGTVWAQIEADFNTAYTTLPETQAAAGRANKWAAGAYLAKALLFQKKFDAAATLFETVIASGKTTNGKPYGLAAKYNDVFNMDTENNEEHVFSVQAAAGTGTVNNTQSDFVLNFTYTSPAVGCCGILTARMQMVCRYWMVLTIKQQMQ